MQRIPDHPAIRAAEEYGYGAPGYEPVYECPVCGEELYPDDGVYMVDGVVVGCKFCYDEDEWRDEDVEEAEAEDMYG